MIVVNDTFSLDESEIQYEFVRASGPGGQNVNKVAAAVQLRFNIRESKCLPADVRSRLELIAGSRVTQEGVLVIDARRFRTQDQNRVDALARLISLVQQALIMPKTRKKTKTPHFANAARLNDKRQTSRQKRFRHYDPDDWE